MLNNVTRTNLSRLLGMSAKRTTLLGDSVGTTTATGTGGTSTATLNKYRGVITTGAITTASGASHVMTVTNNVVAAGDTVIATVVGGTNTRRGLSLISTVTGANTFTIDLYNGNASAINGNVQIYVEVIPAS